jgi:hypothetical protein
LVARDLDLMKPFVLNTAGYHHGERYSPITKICRAYGWILVDVSPEFIEPPPEPDILQEKLHTLTEDPTILKQLQEGTIKIGTLRRKIAEEFAPGYLRELETYEKQQGTRSNADAQTKNWETAYSSLLKELGSNFKEKLQAQRTSENARQARALLEQESSAKTRQQFPQFFTGDLMKTNPRD